MLDWEFVEMGANPISSVVFSQVGLPRWLSGKESPANARDSGLIPGSERSPREGHGNPLQYSCLGDPMDGGAWWAIVP